MTASNGRRGGKRGRERDNVRPFPVIEGGDGLMPQSVPNESAVFGCVLIDPEAMATAAAALVPEDFYRDHHVTIFRAALAMHAEGMPVDVLTLTDALEHAGKLEEVGGASYVSSLANLVPHSGNVATYAKVVKRAATLRRLINASAQISAIAYAKDADPAAALAEAAAAIETVRDAARLDTHFHLMGLGEVDAMPLPVWLVGATLQRDSLAMVYGRRSTGKSFLCLDLALHVALGWGWQGLGVKAGPVVYVASEGARGMGIRSQAWRLEHGVADVPGFFLVGEPIQLLDAGMVAEFIATLETLPEPPALIVIDTLGRSISGADEQSNTDAHEVITAADQIRRATGACVLLVHHDGKDGNRGPRGASAWGDDIDTLIYLKRDEDGDVTNVTCEKQKDGEPFAPFAFSLRKVSLDDHADVVSCVIEPAAVRPASAPAQSDAKLNASQTAMLTALHGHPEGLTAGEWCDLSNTKERQAFNIRKELVRLGLAVNNAGKYFLTQQGLELLQ